MTNDEFMKKLDSLTLQDPMDEECQNQFCQIIRQGYDENLDVLILYIEISERDHRQLIVSSTVGDLLMCFTDVAHWAAWTREGKIGKCEWCSCRMLIHNLFNQDGLKGLAFNPLPAERQFIARKEVLQRAIPGPKPKPPGFREMKGCSDEFPGRTRFEREAESRDFWEKLGELYRNRPSGGAGDSEAFLAVQAKIGELFGEAFRRDLDVLVPFGDGSRSGAMTVEGAAASGKSRRMAVICSSISYVSMAAPPSEKWKPIPLRKFLQTLVETRKLWGIMINPTPDMKPEEELYISLYQLSSFVPLPKEDPRPGGHGGLRKNRRRKKP